MEGYKTLYWRVISILFFTIVIGIVTYFIVKSGAGTLVPQGMEEKVKEVKLLYSPDCFAYQDKNGRTYTEFIDVDKFTDETLEKCVINPYLGENQRGMLIELSYTSKDTGLRISKEVRTTTWKLRTREETVQNTYVVNVKDEGAGTIRFIHS